MRALQNQYQLIEQNLQAYFDGLTKDIDSFWVSEQKLSDFETRSDKIAKGSVKSLIQHYSETYPEVKYPKLNINFSSSVLFSTLKALVSVQDGRQLDGFGSASPLTTNAQEVKHSPKPTYTKPFLIDDNILPNGSFMAPYAM